MRNNLIAIIIGLLASAICVHYLEEELLVVALPVRSLVYGEQVYTSALQGCGNLTETKAWVHPATLALTVYGDAWKQLTQQLEDPPLDVLPAYSQKPLGKREMICVADFLLRSSIRSRINGSWVRTFSYDIPESTYGLPSGWVSGLAQSLTGQVFLAAYKQTGDELYAIAAVETARLMTIPIEQGGVLHQLDQEQHWYAEYAIAGREPPMVLNGHLLALDYLYWMTVFFPDDVWEVHLGNGIKAASNNINRFLSPNWSYYDLRQRYASGKYHRFHVRQVHRYAGLDPSGRLLEAANRMNRQLIFPLGIFERLLFQPSRLLIFLVGFVFAVLSAVYLSYRMFTNRHRKT